MLSELAALSVFGCRLSLCRVVFFFKMLCMCCQIDEGVFFICMQIKHLQSWHDFKNVSAEIRIVHLCFINLTQGTFLHLHIVTGICQCLLCVKYNSIYTVFPATYFALSLKRSVLALRIMGSVTFFLEITLSKQTNQRQYKILPPRFCRVHVTVQLGWQVPLRGKLGQSLVME